MAIIIFGLGFYLKNSELISDSGEDSVEQVGNFVFYAMVIFGGIGVVIGGLALLAAFIKHYCCIACYCIWGIIVAIIYLIIGAIMLYAGTVGKNGLDSFCTDNGSDIQFIQDIDSQLGDVVSSYMCTSSYCPCPSDLDFTQWDDEDDNNFWGRTLSPISNSYTPIYAGIPGETTFSTLVDCYETRKDDSTYDTFTNSVKQGQISFFSFLEDSLDCSGICTPGLFWFTKDVNTGKPGKNCIDGLKSEFGKYTDTIGGCLIVAFFLTICGWFAHFALWKCNNRGK